MSEHDHHDHDHAEGVYVIQGADGEGYHCQLLQVFEFEEAEYAILLRLEPPEDQGLLVMSMTEQDEQLSFSVIATDEEFDRVIQYVHQLAEDAGLIQ